MRYWFDTEFIEDGKTIDLMSIGIVSEDNREYYAELEECDLSKANKWVKSNAIPHLIGKKFPRKVVALQVLNFIGTNKPEIWAYYADYDWVTLCQLFGTMMDLPKSWPMYCRDIKQFCDSIGNPELPMKNNNEHNALADAKWNKAAWEFLNAHRR